VPQQFFRQRSQTFRPVQADAASPAPKEHPLDDDPPRLGPMFWALVGLALGGLIWRDPHAKAVKTMKRETPMTAAPPQGSILREVDVKPATPAAAQVPIPMETDVRPPVLTPRKGPLLRELPKGRAEHVGKSIPSWPRRITPKSFFWAGNPESKRPARGVSNICLVGRDDEDHIKRVVFHTDGHKNPIFPEEISRLIGKSAGTLEQNLLSREVRQARSTGISTVTGIIMFDADE
jgi:hypothetical protein